MCLAAATQHAESYKEGVRNGCEHDHELEHEHEEHAVRQESVSSDNDYSEEQYAPQQRSQPLRIVAVHAESEEEKKEKRRVLHL